MKRQFKAVARLIGLILVVVPAIVLGMLTVLFVYEAPSSLANEATNPTDELTRRAFLPMLNRRTLNGRCQGYNASLTLTSTRTHYQVGETFGVTLTLTNHGCVNLGLPAYNLYLEPQEYLTPTTQATQVHYLGVPPGGSDTASFVFTAVSPGVARLSGDSGFELHFESGPPLWGGERSEPLTITVSP